MFPQKCETSIRALVRQDSCPNAHAVVLHWSETLLELAVQQSALKFVSEVA